MCVCGVCVCVCMHACLLACTEACMFLCVITYIKTVLHLFMFMFCIYSVTVCMCNTLFLISICSNTPSVEHSLKAFVTFHVVLLCLCVGYSCRLPCTSCASVLALLYINPTFLQHATLPCLNTQVWSVILHPATTLQDAQIR